MNTNELHSLHSTPARMTCKLKQKKKAKKKKSTVFPGTHYRSSEAVLNVVLTEL